MHCHLNTVAAIIFYCCMFSGALKPLPQYNFPHQNLSVVRVPQKTVFPVNQQANILTVTGSKQNAGNDTIALLYTLS